jgi:hypothetical protein
MALGADRMTRTVKELPAQRAALHPACPFRPAEQHPAAPISGDGGIFASVRSVGGVCGGRESEGFGLNFIEINITGRLLGGERSITPFVQICRAHGAGPQKP